MNRVFCQLEEEICRSVKLWENTILSTTMLDRKVLLMPALFSTHVYNTRTYHTYESQKGINAIQQCSVQNQKGAINIIDNVHR